MKLQKKLILTLLFVLGSSKLYVAQSIDKYNMWYQYFMTAKVSDKTNFGVFAHYWTFDMGGDPRLFLLGTFAEHEVFPGVKPGAGVMYLNLNRYNEDRRKLTRNEIRPYQQVTLGQKIGRANISHRFRVEERFLSNPDELRIRLRYLFSMRFPLIESGKYYGIFKDEIRMYAAKTDIFNTNRITAGFGMKFNNTTGIELAFINQLAESRTDNYVSIVFRNNFDWRKKK